MNKKETLIFTILTVGGMAMLFFAMGKSIEINIGQNQEAYNNAMINRKCLTHTQLSIKDDYFCDNNITELDRLSLSTN